MTVAECTMLLKKSCCLCVQPGNRWPFYGDEKIIREQGRVGRFAIDLDEAKRVFQESAEGLLAAKQQSRTWPDFMAFDHAYQVTMILCPVRMPRTSQDKVLAYLAWGHCSTEAHALR